MRAAFVLLLVAAARVAFADGAVDQAEKHFQAGATAFKLGQWERAIAEYSASYQLSPQPQLLYDLAEAYEAKLDRPLAIHSYKLFLAAPCTQCEDLVERAKQRVERLRGQLEAPPQVAPVHVAPLVNVSVHATANVTANVHVHMPPATAGGWATGALGLAALAGGLGLFIHSQQLEPQIASAPTVAAQENLVSDTNHYRVAGAVLIGAGGAGLIASVVVLAVSSRQSAPKRVSLYLAPTRGGALLGLGGSL